MQEIQINRSEFGIRSVMPDGRILRRSDNDYKELEIDIRYYVRNVLFLDCDINVVRK